MTENVARDGDRSTDQDADLDDRRLVARLRAADPASGLPPLGPQALDHLLATTMQTPPATGQDPTEPAAPVTATVGGLVDLAARRRRRVAAGVLGVAAAGAVVLAGTTLLGQGGAGQPGGPDVVALQASPAGGPAAICADLTPDVLAGNDLAVAGDVTSIQGDTVTLTVTESYTGPLSDGDTLTVPQGDPAQVVDGAAPSFTEGGSYLVAATDEFVAGCGATAADSPELRSLYGQAFPQ